MKAARSGNKVSIPYSLETDSQEMDYLVQGTGRRPVSLDLTVSEGE